MKFGIIDILLIGLFLLFAIRGARRGIIRELSSLIGVIASIELARIYYPFIANSLLGKLVLPSSVLSVIAFLLTFLLFYIIAILVGFLMHIIVSNGATNIIDKILGGLFSLAKIVILVAFTVFLLKNFGPSKNFSTQLVSTSPILKTINDQIISSVSRNWIRKSIKRIKRIKNDVLHG